jgi:hypothetical protein
MPNQAENDYGWHNREKSFSKANRDIIVFLVT